jgi:hypothetical protein
MNDDFDSIQILQEMMLELRGLALKRAVPISDIVHEALGEYLLARTNGVNLFDIIYSIENEMRRAEVGQFMTNADPSGLAIFIKSPIRYVYRPELKYEVRIIQNNKVSVGKLGVVLRSQDMDMIELLSGFVCLWIELERIYLLRNRVEQIMYLTDAGYFGRQIYYPDMVEQGNSQSIGDAISNYIRAFDELLKHYLNHGAGSKEIEKLYLAKLNDGKLTI